MAPMTTTTIPTPPANVYDFPSVVLEIPNLKGSVKLTANDGSVRASNHPQYDRTIGRNGTEPNGVSDLIVRGIAHTVDFWMDVEYQTNGVKIGTDPRSHRSVMRREGFANEATSAARRKVLEEVQMVVAAFLDTQDGARLFCEGVKAGRANKAARLHEKLVEAQAEVDRLTAEYAEAMSNYAAS